MVLPPNPRGMTVSGARSLSRDGCQRRMLELPVTTMAPAGGIMASSAASNAWMAFSNRVGVYGLGLCGGCRRDGENDQ